MHAFKFHIVMFGIAVIILITTLLITSIRSSEADCNDSIKQAQTEVNKLRVQLNKLERLQAGSKIQKQNQQDKASQGAAKPERLVPTM